MSPYFGAIRGAATGIPVKRPNMKTRIFALAVLFLSALAGFTYLWSTGDGDPSNDSAIAGEVTISKIEGGASGFRCGDPITDVEGNVYNTVQIGGQCWMAENLATETFRDGTPASAWSYGGNPANKAIYGLLYNWHTAVDSRGICPAGWHVPTDGEWTELTDHLGGRGVAGGRMKTTGTLGAGTGLWTPHYTSATNSSGFSGLPGGYRFIYGNYDGLGDLGYWWSATEHSTDDAWYHSLGSAGTLVGRNDYDKKMGFSVRCVRDE
jgi:uncharacterized protein (TIGR02145 family)